MSWRQLGSDVETFYKLLDISCANVLHNVLLNVGQYVAELSVQGRSLVSLLRALRMLSHCIS